MSQNGVVQSYVFRLQNFRGKGPPKLDAGIFMPLGTHHVETIGAILQQTRRYTCKPKYTRFLANFRILGVKKLLGADPRPMRYALASVVPAVKFLGSHAPYPLTYEHPKKLILSGSI